MQGRTAVDVHLSLLEYLAHVLPVEYDVQSQRREPQTRPLCVCQPVGQRVSSGTAYVREFVQAYEVLLYPPGADASPRAAQLLAQRTGETTLRALDSGAGTGRNRGYALRVPLFDYAGIADDEPLPDDALPIDYLVLTNLDADVRPDAEQDDLYTVLIDFRVNWRDDGDTRRFEGAILEGIGLRVEPVQEYGP